MGVQRLRGSDEVLVEDHLRSEPLHMRSSTYLDFTFILRIQDED